MFKLFKALFIINNMSLEYYLLSRKKYDSIINYLKEIIENYNDIFSYTTELDIDEGNTMLDCFQPNVHKDQMTNKLIVVSHLRHICEENIQKLCIHEFVNDTIDIGQERSQNITYCKVCEYTVPI
jgi:hypothetical protein